MTFRAQPLDQQGNLLDVPGHDRVVQHGQATEGVKLILEFTPVQPAFLAETEEGDRSWDASPLLSSRLVRRRKVSSSR